MAEIYRSVHASATIAVSENERGELMRRAGRPAEAAEHFARALEALGAVPEPDPATHSAILGNLALTAHQRGDLAQAKRFLVRSLEVGPLVGDPIGRAITYDNLGVVEVELARLAGLRPPADENRPDTRPEGDPRLKVQAHPEGDPRPKVHARLEIDPWLEIDARLETESRPVLNARRETGPWPETDARPEHGSRATGRVEVGERAGRSVVLTAGARPRAARAAAQAHLGEAETHFAAAERLFRRVLPEGVDDYLRSVLNRADAAALRGDTARMDRLTRHAAELAAHHGITPENAVEAVTMRGGFLHRHRERPRSAVELMTARLPALLPVCPAELSAAALSVLRAAAAATGDPALVDDVTARIGELAGGRPVHGTKSTHPAGSPARR